MKCNLDIKSLHKQKKKDYHTTLTLYIVDSTFKAHGNYKYLSLFFF